MPLALRRSLVVAVLGLLLGAVGLVGAPPSLATAVPRVSGVALASQDWYHQRLTLRWSAVRGATYQLRWSASARMYGASRPLATATSSGTAVSPLSRAHPWYFQARAIRSGTGGAWSAPTMVRFTNAYPQTPAAPTFTTTTPGVVSVGWAYTSFASRYRVVWSPKPYGTYQEHPTTPYPGWLSQYARSSSTRVSPTYSSDPGQRAIQTALPYGNPLFFRLQANNQFITSSVATRSTAWSRAVFPPIPTPAAGAPVRLGTYSLRQNMTEEAVQRTADAIRSNGLSVVALQEARIDPGLSMAPRIARALGWSVVPARMQQQLIFDPAKFTATATGEATVYNYARTSGQLTCPYARLVPNDEGSAPFWVVSAQFTDSPRATQVQGNTQTAADARELTTQLDKVAGSEPIVVAGDLGSNREPYADSSTGAQQAFVENGFWDARASLDRSGVQYSTNNGGASVQRDYGVGIGSRSTYIMSKGIHGSMKYVNVANQPDPLTDHNLVWADLQVPPSSAR